MPTSEHWIIWIGWAVGGVVLIGVIALIVALFADERRRSDELELFLRIADTFCPSRSVRGSSAPVPHVFAGRAIPALFSSDEMRARGGARDVRNNRLFVRYPLTVR
jgi:hypothetical protein